MFFVFFAFFLDCETCFFFQKTITKTNKKTSKKWKNNKQKNKIILTFSVSVIGWLIIWISKKEWLVIPFPLLGEVNCAVNDDDDIDAYDAGGGGEDSGDCGDCDDGGENGIGDWDDCVIWELLSFE